MKKNAQPVFEAKWWSTNQPKGLTKGKGLEAALEDYEKARAALQKSGAEDDVKPAVVAIGKVRQAVELVISEADKMKKAPPKGADAEDLGNTVDALKKFTRLYDSEKAELDKLVKEDEEDNNVFTDAVQYKKYLLKGLRKAAGGDPMNFGIVLGKAAADHRLALSKSKGPNSLGRQAQEATGLRVMTFGTLVEDPDRPEFVKLNLEGKQIPGLKKKTDRMLKAFKPLPYSHVILMVNGEEVDDLDDPDDTDVDAEETATQQAQPNPQDPTFGQLRANFEKIFPTLSKLLGSNGPTVPQLAAAAKAFQAAMHAFDANAAKQHFNEIVAAMRGAVPTQTGTGAGQSQGQSQGQAKAGPVEYAALLQRWSEARGKAANDLQALRAAILDEFKNEPEFAAIQQNISRLDAIMTTLGPSLQEKLTAAQAASEADRQALNKQLLDEARTYAGYVASDQLVAAVQDNPFTPIDLRGTLSTPLADIEKALAA
ncbi:MAG TPA: hypothetical protein VHB27_19505 [Rhodopila sp.]|uniref:hypothetical protein n=1 Tax=Rhodopila sp. TaxID=2480087 RepID=UPI002C9DFA08|nr:hypothetical protein [Rhodopila sp.]HVY17418.1 hypothetical protein [Rhodopila sp.]